MGSEVQRGEQDLLINPPLEVSPSRPSHSIFYVLLGGVVAIFLASLFLTREDTGWTTPNTWCGATYHRNPIQYATMFAKYSCPTLLKFGVMKLKAARQGRFTRAAFKVAGRAGKRPMLPMQDI
jgi:hypothetical protein